MSEPMLLALMAGLPGSKGFAVTFNLTEKGLQSSDRAEAFISSFTTVCAISLFVLSKSDAAKMKTNA